MTRFRLDLSYDGTGFHGWAAQPGTELRTVQGVLEDWLSRLLRLPHPSLTCAGRTDAGVHARGQVAHLDLDVTDPEETAHLLRRRLPRVLPEDLVLREISIAPAGFDARFAALWRRYVFRLCDGIPDPLWRGQVLRLNGDLDLATMNSAGTALLGLHDFAGFCRWREGASTIRTLLACQTSRVLSGPLSGVVEVEVRADAFCHSMVRSLVGALVEVGRGRRAPEWPASLLDRPGRAGDVRVLPPHGLTLEEVRYPHPAELAARVEEARARRGDPEPRPAKEPT